MSGRKIQRGKPKAAQNESEFESFESSQNGGNEIPESKMKLYSKLIKENEQLRQVLNLEKIQYLPEYDLKKNVIDSIIEDLLDHNEIMRKEAKTIETSNRAVPYSRHEMFIDLDGNQHGCSFWVPLNENEIFEQQEREQSTLPISSLAKKKQIPISKNEKAILMMSRVPPYPPGSLQLTNDQGEYNIIVSWIDSLLKIGHKIVSINKTNNFTKFIELERKQMEIRLVTHISEQVDKYYQKNFDSPVIVSQHMNFVSKELLSQGMVSFLICGFVFGNSCINQCHHTTLPMNDQEIKQLKYDSLLFQMNNQSAIFALNPSNIVPLYIVTIKQ